MELREFVSTVLSQIADGVIDAQEATAGKGEIRVAVFGGMAGKSQSNHKDTHVSRISFSLPVCWTSAYEKEQEKIPTGKVSLVQRSISDRY